MLIKIIKPFQYNGARCIAGSIVEVDEAIAITAIKKGLATQYKEEQTDEVQSNSKRRTRRSTNEPGEASESQDLQTGGDPGSLSE